MKTKIMQQENPKGAGVQQHLERPGAVKTFCGRKYTENWGHTHDFDLGHESLDDYVSCTVCKKAAQRYLTAALIQLSLEEQEAIYRLLAVRKYELEGLLEKFAQCEELRVKYEAEIKLVESSRGKIYSDELYRFMDKKIL